MFDDKQEFDQIVKRYFEQNLFYQNELNNENIHNWIRHLNYLFDQSKLLPNVQMNNINLFHLIMIIYNNIKHYWNMNDVYDQINYANEIFVLLSKIILREGINQFLLVMGFSSIKVQNLINPSLPVVTN
jgi:hypothetical protein